MHNRYSLAGLLALTLAAINVSNASGQNAKDQAKSRNFLFTYAGKIKELKAGQAASIWLPVAISGPEQDVSIKSSNLPASSTRTAAEKQYGNTSLFFESKADDKGEIWFEVVYAVTRREVK